MKTKDTLSQASNRQKLINMANGGHTCYHIDYCIDIKGNITILGGFTMPDRFPEDMFIRRATEFDIHLYDGWKHGADLVRMEAEQAEKLERSRLVAAYLQFRKEHPKDGYGITHDLLIRQCNWPEDGNQALRNDAAEVDLMLKRRNRQYIKELYGEDLPVDFDFRKDYDARLDKVRR